MQPTRISTTECPAARALECVGDWWSILILRDAFQGFTRFDEFRKSLGVAPNILSRRLAHLTEVGVFERRLYSEKPPRHEYVLTEMGRDFHPVLVTLITWGNKHLAPEGQSLVLARRDTLAPLDPVVSDGAGGPPITPDNLVLLPGPGASTAMRDRLSSIRALRPDTPDPER